MDRATIDVYEARASEWQGKRPPQFVGEAHAFSRRCLPGRPRVDLGCGPGGYLPLLGRPVVGLDASWAMLELARPAAPGALLVRSELEHLPFARASLGGAWARASYLHLPRVTVPAALAQLHAALADGAALELTLLAGAGEGPRADDDFPGRFFAHWGPDSLRDVVLGAGFDVEELSARGEWLVARARRARTLPDFVGPAMRVLACGLNPSLVAADAGYGFAGATNRFWAAATESGLVAPAQVRRPLAALAGGLGMTDLVKRATPRASGLTPAEYRAGAERVGRLVEWLRPGLTLFVGLEGWRAAIDRRARPGLQPEPFHGAPAYVMPSTSGINAHSRMTDLVEHFKAASAAAGQRRAQLAGG